MNKITNRYAEKLIKSSNGTFFSAKFVKSNGRVRTINCRLGVRKGLTGKGLTFNPSEYSLLTVYDVQAKGYRMINLGRLKQVTTQGKTYRVV